jgi:hypothetical protein
MGLSWLSFRQLAAGTGRRRSLGHFFAQRAQLRGIDPARAETRDFLRQAILSPWRSSMVCTKFEVLRSDSCVPVSSQAKPRPAVPRAAGLFQVFRFRSVISSSPRAEGLEAAATSQTVPS